MPRQPAIYGTSYFTVTAPRAGSSREGSTLEAANLSGCLIILMECAARANP